LFRRETLAIFDISIQTKTTVMKKHFIALVKMEGGHEGKIGQHSTDQTDLQAAIKWGRNRFNRPFAIVEMPDPNKLSLESTEAETLYNTSTHYENN
jgi:hypothetical protein